MVVYRISNTKYCDDLSGEGARINGGRWNHKLTPCVYTSESRALATLEFTVNVNIHFIPKALSVVAIEVLDSDIKTISLADLPGNWKDSPAPVAAKDFGTSLLRKTNTYIIKIPSVIIPDEFNYLLNPIHPNAGSFKILSIKDFLYDVRIKLT